MTISLKSRPEYLIEQAVIEQSNKVLGYKGKLEVIRRVLLSRGAGSADLILLPNGHQHRLVLVEAKRAASPEASGQVVGQLLRYYAGALTLGADGLKILKKYAKADPDQACSVTKKFPQAMCGGVHRDKAFPMMEAGTKIDPASIGLVIALDGPARPNLKHMLRLLQERHQLDIHLVELNNGILSSVDVVAPGA
jgi:hypothetical protein